MRQKLGTTWVGIVSACVSLPLFAAAQAWPIKHVIMIMQENRSFDSYFGTFPGANGIPAGACIPLNPSKPSQGCVVPFHDPRDVNSGGPHKYEAALADLDDGVTTSKNDGFVYEQAVGASSCSPGSANGAAVSPKCAGVNAGVNRHDSVGYHTAAELPNYWAYAQHFVLQDAMFEGDRSWSLDSHLEMTSEWSAICGKPPVLASCTSTHSPLPPSSTKPNYPWVNLFQLMDLNSVTWKYYLGSGEEPDCEDGEMTCEPQTQKGGIVGFLNPLPGFVWAQQKGASYVAAHNPDLDQFLLDVKGGTLAQVSWIIPAEDLSEHPLGGVTAGMEYVTSLVNAVMQSKYWKDTAIFIAWDDFGGFYDHVSPPIVDYNADGSEVQGFGLRVPAMMVSAYAKSGMIDHSILSFDSYAVLIEQLFMGGAHLDPVALGQPDNRPTVRDALTMVEFVDGTTAPIGHLIDEFDFTQAPLAPLILSTHIPTRIAVDCGAKGQGEPQACLKSAVTVKWYPVAGAEVPGPFTYNVLRDGGTTPVCTSTQKSCVDTSPGPGVHFYTVYSVDGSKVASPSSAAAEADIP